MGMFRSAKNFLRRNPALELLLGIGICTAAVTPVWMLAGRYPETSSKKYMESSRFKKFKENFFQMQENDKLNFLLQECEKSGTETLRLNKESEASSSRKQ